MIDSVKRKTLKFLAVATGTIATASAAKASSILTKNTAQEMKVKSYRQLEISARLSTQTNELEIVVTNAGAKNTSITQTTPEKICHSHGDFHLQSALANGTLKAGESIVVPLSRNSLNRNVALQHSAASLNYVIKNSS